MNASLQQTIGVDVGGTKILAGLVDRDGRVLDRRERPTPTESESALFEELVSAVEELLGDRVAAVGFGVPSRMEQGSGRAIGSVNIPLHDIALRDEMVRRLGLPVGVDNDANVAAFAEWAFGAGRGVQDLVVLTLGTGVGGGLVLGGRPYRGWAEVGHIVVEYDGAPCACGGRGHLESYCSGAAASATAEQVFGRGTDARGLLDLARLQDARALEVLGGIGRRLGAGIGSLVNLFNPQAVVIGGGFGIAAFDYLITEARWLALREALDPADETLSILPAALGEDAGMIGAALIAYEALETT
jgi:glucokinase